MEHKRTADDAGLDTAPDRPSKSFRIEDFLESMDPSVRIKLRSMFDDGLLQADDLDERNIAELKKFDAAVALEILEHYSGADFSTVRNRRAYLAGAIKRKAHMAIKPVLHSDVQKRLNQLIAAGSMRSTDLDKRCMEVLANLHPAKALTVLERYSSKDFSEVRNPSALFMATVKAVDAHAASVGDWSGDTRHGGGGGRGRGGYSGHGGGGGYGGYQDGPPARGHHAYLDQPPPPSRPPPPPPGGLGLQGVTVVGSSGPGSLGFTGQVAPQPADGLAALAGMLGMPGVQAGGVLAAPAAGGVQLPAGLQLPPGVQAVTFAPGVQPGTVIQAGVGGQPQYVLSAGGVLTAAPVGATIISAAPTAAGGYAVQAAAGGGLPPAAAVVPQGGTVAGAGAVPAGVPPEWAIGRKQYGLEQSQLGVRVSEFHGLSPFAVFVHPSPALKLQQLWDDGNELVSMLDDKVWQVLAETPAPEALAIIEEAGEALANPQAQIRNINAFFMSVVRKVMPNVGGGQQGHHSREGHRGGYGGGRGGGRGYDSRDRYEHRGRDDYRDTSGASRSYGRDRDGPGSRQYSSGSQDRGDRSSGASEGGRREFSRTPSIHLLPPDQRARAEELCREHAPLLREEHFDEGVIGTMQRLAPGDAMRVLNELGQNSMAGVRNLPAYIMGICKRYYRGEAGGAGGPPGRGGGRGGGPPLEVKQERY